MIDVRFHGRGGQAAKIASRMLAAAEYHGGTQAQTRQTIEEKIATNTGELPAHAKQNPTLPCQAAVALAEATAYQ